MKLQCMALPGHNNVSKGLALVNANHYFKNPPYLALKKLLSNLSKGQCIIYIILHISAVNYWKTKPCLSVSCST